MDEGNLRIDDEEEIISAITHALCYVLDKESRKKSLARLLCSSYSAVEKIVCSLSLVQLFLECCMNFIYFQLFRSLYLHVPVCIGVHHCNWSSFMNYTILTSLLNCNMIFFQGS